MHRVSSQTTLHLATEGFCLSANGGQRKVVVLATDYSPQKVRPEDSRERQKNLELSGEGFGGASQ